MAAIRGGAQAAIEIRRHRGRDQQRAGGRGPAAAYPRVSGPAEEAVVRSAADPDKRRTILAEPEARFNTKGAACKAKGAFHDIHAYPSKDVVQETAQE